MDSFLLRRLTAVTTAHVADACVRTAVPVRFGPPGAHPVVPGTRLAGPVLPVRHAGSVHVLLEALGAASPGDVLVVDNEGRLDEACVGDLTAAAASDAGVAGIVVWGLHRDTAEVRSIGLPLFSLGAIPCRSTRDAPRQPDALTAATIGNWTVTRDDVVLADDDGVLFVPSARLAEVVTAAEEVRAAERSQADRILAGHLLRDRVRVGAHLALRAD